MKTRPDVNQKGQNLTNSVDLRNNCCEKSDHKASKTNRVEKSISTFKPPIAKTDGYPKPISSSQEPGSRPIPLAQDLFNLQSQITPKGSEPHLTSTSSQPSHSHSSNKTDNPRTKDKGSGDTTTGSSNRSRLSLPTNKGNNNGRSQSRCRSSSKSSVGDDMDIEIQK
ncbi:hypothetical protein GWI33_020399 [Rhynchophorus ferrugineus]|uniref:Uncharacterized protein n=1 Tax=Rhynchophorus ferrugineus TaxID=354439 RepID=A0A834HSP4_RHYFE|nr:hypothetical protein GWI33_020399 [Rhynchophorus ferrugineus]